MGFKVSIFCALGLIFILNLSISVFSEKNKLTFCMVNFVPNFHRISVTCNLTIKSETTDLNCILGTDRIDCLRRLVNDDVDFMFAEPEDLHVLAMSENYSNKVLITHEFSLRRQESMLAKWVAVSRKNIVNVSHVQKTRFCAPGFEEIYFSHFYMRFFLKTLIKPECDPKKTLLDNRMSAMSIFFESACLRKPWVFDYHFDTNLKEKYVNLCTQCENAVNCAVAKRLTEKDHSFFCLLSNRGDVGWFTLYDAQRNFKRHKSIAHEFHLLCLDGSTRNVTADSPCIWLEEPRQTIIVRKDFADKVSKFITEQVNEGGDLNEFLQTFKDERTDVAIVKKVKKRRTPIDYLKAGYRNYYSLKDEAQCKPADNRTIKWCLVTNLEAQKCEWLSNAAKSRGIEPLFVCVQESSREDCLESVKKGRSDIFSINPSENSETTEKGLKPIVYMVSSKGYEDESVAIVRKLTNYYSLMDLKCATACFGGYRDSGWDTFIYMMAKLTGNNDWFCNDKEMVSQFFKESCVVGLSKKNTTFPKNLYSYCANVFMKHSEPEVKNLGCLFFGGDVAFDNMRVTQFSLPDTFEKPPTKPICLNRLTHDSEEVDKCYLAWKTLGSIVVHKNISEVREDEIYQTLMSLDRYFGTHPVGPTAFMFLYGLFSGDKDIIFPGGTHHLERKVCPESCNPINYQEILKELSIHRESCNLKNFSTTESIKSTHCQEISEKLSTKSSKTSDQSSNESISLILGQEFYVIIALLLIYLLPIFF